MSEEEREELAKPKSGSAGKIVLIAALIIVPAVAAFITYRFVLSPMFSPVAEEATTAVENRIPMGTVMMDFNELRATVDTGNPNTPALLQYSVTLACANEKTMLLVETWRQLFQAMLVRLHDSRTKEELVDAAAKDEMLRQVKQEANTILKRVQETDDPEVRVLDVVYTEYTVIEL